MSSRSVASKMFRLLHKHQDLILDAYADGAGELTEVDENSSAIEELIRHRLAWQPDADSPAMLSSSLRQLLDHGLRNERLSRIDADVGGRMAAIEQACISYVRASSGGELRDASSLLLHVKEQVYELTELLQENTRKLWRRIESDFDYVESIGAKQRENQQTLESAERLIQGLDEIDVGELQKQAGNNRELKRLFGLTLPEAISSCRKELVDALHRLNDMLFRLRKLEQRGELVRNLDRLFSQNPGVDLSLHADREPLPAIARRQVPCVSDLYADIANPAFESDFTAMLVGLRTTPVADESLAGKRVSVQEQVLPAHIIQTPELKRAIRSVFVDVLGTGESLTARATFDRASGDCAMEDWLHGLAGEYNAMQALHRTRFRLCWEGQYHPLFNGNFYANDLRIERA